MNKIEILNLEEGMPSVKEAITILKRELEYYKKYNKKCIVIIHGYGSSGVGGSIKIKVRQYLNAQKEKNLIKTVINGGNFSIYNNEALTLKNKYPELNEYLTQFNSGITIIELF